MVGGLPPSFSGCHHQQSMDRPPPSALSSRCLQPTSRVQVHMHLERTPPAQLCTIKGPAHSPHPQPCASVCTFLLPGCCLLPCPPSNCCFPSKAQFHAHLESLFQPRNQPLLSLPPHPRFSPSAEYLSAKWPKHCIVLTCLHLSFNYAGSSLGGRDHVLFIFFLTPIL